jgi:dipeptidyl aminopeptidase/acylaminoacyl peptidase
MRERLTAASAAVAFCALCTLSAPSLAQILPPVEAFGELPAISDARLSPDGTHFAAIQPLDGRPAVAIYQMHSGAAKPAVYGDTVGTIFEIGWAKNDRLVIYDKENVQSPGDKYIREWTRAYSVDLSAGDPVMLMNNSIFVNANVTTTHVLDVDLDDPNTIFMEMYAEGITLFRVNVHTGESHIAAAPPGTSVWTSGWIMDGHGKIVGRLTSPPGRTKSYGLSLFKDGSWVTAEDYAKGDDGEAGLEGLLADGSALVVRHTGDTGTVVLSRFDLATTSPGAILFSDPQYDIGATLFDAWTMRVIGTAYATDAMHFRYFDPAMQSLQHSLELAFSGRTVLISSLDRDASHMIVETWAPRAPPEYYFLDRSTMRASSIGSAYPTLAPDQLGEMKSYPYKARDGLDIPAFITLPPGKAPKALPLVVMPHGGPNERDMIGFDWWAQFLANRGYAVFQPNYRGSTGYGLKFKAAGDLQWGRKMQDDITDGVKKLIEDGTVDPRRICIVGASYGGYAALAGAAFSPDLYACAVSFAGVSDLHSFELWQERRQGKYWPYKNFTEHIAASVADADAVSPALHADQVRIPVLLMHAANDITVPIEQSEEMRDALKKAGKDVTYVKMDGDDHYFSLSSTRIGMLKETERFLAAHIGP